MRQWLTDQFVIRMRENRGRIDVTSFLKVLSRKKRVQFPNALVSEASGLIHNSGEVIQFVDYTHIELTGEGGNA